MTPNQIGPFKIEAEIGRGGMATVYRATQLSLGRPVALKVLAHNLTSDPGLVERFRHEAVIASHLSHPNIVQIYDTGEDSGHYYIAMEYIDGPTLAQVIQAKGTLEAPYAAAVILAAAEALAVAHARGVVHRDIKPANIMQCRTGRVVVMDFGIARAAQMSSLTATGFSVGTPAYMSPEQAMGQKVDGRTDLYALGVVLYQALTGRAPFAADSPVATLLQHVHHIPPSIREQRPDLPQWLELVVSCCLAKNPDHRYQRAEDLCIDLREGMRSGRAPLAEALVRTPGFGDATIILQAPTSSSVRASSQPPKSSPSPPPRDLPRQQAVGTVAAKSATYSYARPFWYVMLMTVATFGFYLLVWFYRAWKMLLKHYNLKGYALVNALFSPFCAWSFFRYAFMLGEEGGYQASLPSNNVAWIYFLIWCLRDVFSFVMGAVNGAIGADVFNFNYLIFPALFLLYIPLKPGTMAMNAGYMKLLPGARMRTSLSAWSIVFLVLGCLSWLQTVAVLLLMNK